MRKPNLKNYRDVSNALRIKSFAADLSLYYLDKYDRKKIHLLHEAVAFAVEDAFMLALIEAHRTDNGVRVVKT